MDFSWPEDLQVSSEAKDIVERLLKLKPGQRLGAGRPGTPNDYHMLMKHPYFAQVDFEHLNRVKVPLELPRAIVEEY